VAAAREGVDPMAAGESVGIYGPGDGARRRLPWSESWRGRADGETRTPNLLFTRQLRYRLRHASTTAISPLRRPSRR
jgi:hypothetical protein